MQGPLCALQRSKSGRNVRFSGSGRVELGPEGWRLAIPGSGANGEEPICFSRYLYRGRDRIEWFFGRIKQCRWVATRYDKFTEKFLVSPSSLLFECGYALMSPRPACLAVTRPAGVRADRQRGLGHALMKGTVEGAPDARFRTDLGRGPSGPLVAD
jgi:hypothetical protein